MSQAVYNKLQFNGFHVMFYNHESRELENQHFPTADHVLARGFDDGFPSVQEFVDDLFDVFGDCVGKVLDNNDVVLYDNWAEMYELYQSMQY